MYRGLHPTVRVTGKKKPNETPHRVLNFNRPCRAPTNTDTGKMVLCEKDTFCAGSRAKNDYYINTTAVRKRWCYYYAIVDVVKLYTWRVMYNIYVLESRALFPTHVLLGSTVEPRRLCWICRFFPLNFRLLFFSFHVAWNFFLLYVNLFIIIFLSLNLSNKRVHLLYCACCFYEEKQPSNKMCLGVSSCISIIL